MTTTTSNPILAFNGASTFYVDPGVVQNSPQVSVTGVELYFKKKPAATNNKSGITNPGVDLFLCELTALDFEEVPDTTKVVVNSHSRVGYANVVVSNTAAVATMFSMPLPPNLETGKAYAIVVKFDGDEEFELWKSVEGDRVVGTNNTTAGPSGKYIGKYYEFSYVAGSGGNTAPSTTNQAGVTGTWKPLNTTDLKFNVYAARYIPDQFANTATEVVARRSFVLPKKPYEFVVFDPLSSNNVSKLLGGELVWQSAIDRPETVAVVAGSTKVTSATANFGTIYGNSSDTKYMVVTSGASRNIRRIVQVVANNEVRLEIPVSFTNAAASFAKVVAGKVDIHSKITSFGRTESALAISDSNANSSLRFTNNVIEVISIANGGTGYANSNYVVVNGGGPGAPEANAYANVTTNANGTITAVKVTNKGIGFLDSPTYVILNANGSPSAGVNANLQFTVGATLLTEHSNAIISNTSIINVPVNTLFAGAVDLEAPYGTRHHVRQHFLYYSTQDGISDVFVVDGGTGYANGDSVAFSGGGSGAAARVTTDSAGKVVDVIMVTTGSGYGSTTGASVTGGGSGAVLSPIVGVARNDVNSSQHSRLINLFERHKLDVADTPLVLSRSYEVMQPNVSIVTETGTTVNTNVSSVVEMVIESNNVFVTTDIISGEVDVFYERYSINDDYTDEHTGHGRAVSKHVSKVVSFGDNRLAEDIRVFMDAYRPVGTDLKVYARIHNSKDPEAFVDKDWTLLEMKNGNGRYSSSVDELDVIEYEFGFPFAPNVEFQATGSVTTTLNQSNLVGSNTSFNTQLAVDDLIVVRSPLFPENSMVAVVNNVVNATMLSIRGTVSNSSVVGTGFIVEKVSPKNQAFNNRQNSNVVRYYSDSVVEYDGYNTFAVKIVFLSNSEIQVPKVEHCYAIGVTA